MSSNTRLYFPIESVKNTFSKVSLNSYYKVAFPLSDRAAGNAGLVSWLRAAGIYDTASTNGLDPIEAIELLCAGTVLPGPNFKTTDTIGNRQGVIEKYPILRQYPELTMTFYVDNNHRIIRFFEEWINFINPLYSGDGVVTSSEAGQDYPVAGNENNFMKFRYPNTYCQRILVTKFEKDLNTTTRVNDTTIQSYNSGYLSYEFIQAYPSNIIVSPVSYQASEILTFTVNFNYSRYIIRRNLSAVKQYHSAITVPDVPTGNALQGFEEFSGAQPFDTSPFSRTLTNEYYNNGIIRGNTPSQQTQGPGQRSQDATNFGRGNA